MEHIGRNARVVGAELLGLGPRERMNFAETFWRSLLARTCEVSAALSGGSRGLAWKEDWEVWI